MSVRSSSGAVVVGALALTTHNTATAVAGAATLDAMSGVVTSEAVTTAAGATYTLTLTNNQIAAADVVLVSVAAGGTGMATVARVTPAAGSVAIIIQNIAGAAAFNAALKISFVVIKATI